jgi:hypothetical protein
MKEKKAPKFKPEDFEPILTIDELKYIKIPELKCYNKKCKKECVYKHEQEIKSNLIKSSSQECG